MKMRSARRKRGECAGEWKWAATASPKQISVIRAATGCTIRIEDSAWRELAGSEKSELGASLKSDSGGNCQFHVRICLSARPVSARNVPVSYPIMGPLHTPFSQ